MKTNSNVVFESLFWKVGERIMVQGLGLIIQILLARILIPEDFACLAIISAIVNFLGLFVHSGLSITVVQKEDLTELDISTLTTISLLVALVMYLCLFLGAPLISDYYDIGNIVWPIRVLGLSLFLFSFNAIQTGLLQRKMSFRTIFYRSMLATPVSGAIGIILAYLGMGVWSLVAYSVSNILLIVLFMNFIPEIKLKLGFSKQRAKELYKFSLKIIGTSLISSGSDTIRTLIIGKHYKPNQLAYFDRGLSYSGIVTQVVNSSLSSVLLPVLSREQNEVSNLKTIARKSVSLSAYIMIPLLTMVAILSKPLVLIILTEKWAPCAIFLSLFCILRIPGIIVSCDKQVYYALGKSQIGLLYELGLLVANLLVLISMIPYGVLIIAISLTIVEYIGNFILFIVSVKIYNYTLSERLLDLIKPIASTLVMAGAIFAISILPINKFALLIIEVIIGVLSYLLFSRIIHDSNYYYIITRIRSYINIGK